ncbi:hypothetical protein [Fodinibius halophilus]|uniref:Uncharacterized protein n=1 Tax=Fodinibius halophilus TaxID=1736908 RepID=A0A6M1SY34_9BACT|nr:hypothetical protein [Fodinibius halophilus]NGP88306.1 hypothetical protein [Fodinibius halophilus]
MTAQRSVGVEWDIPQKPDVAIQQLNQFNELGISILKLTPPVEPLVWRKIEEMGFTVYGDIDISYPITETFAEPDSSLILKIQEKSAALLNRPSVKAIGLFEYGLINEERFQSAIAPFITELQNAGVDSIYYKVSYQQRATSNTRRADFIIRDIHITPANINTLSISNPKWAGVFNFSPAASVDQYLTPFKKFLSVTAEYADKPLLIDSNWLLTKVEEEPTFSTTIQTLTNQAELIFPVPSESLPNDHTSPTPIIILLLIWASVGLHYNSSPLYRKSLFRYFSAHKFFIDDIFQRHIRSVVPAIFLILQNAFLIAAAICVVRIAIFSPRGFDALLYHIPSIAIMGSSGISLSAWAFLLSLALAFISIIWLYISHKQINSLTQVATIYAWPLQVNLVVTSILVVLFSAGAAATLIMIIGILPIMIQLFSFIITSFDAARYSSSRTLVYLLLTSGLFMLIMVVLLIWGLTSPSLTETLSLAASL